MRKRRGRAVSGILVLDKPAGESSNKSLQKVKKIFQAAKAGHTGSLDPLATGVLPLCFGEATKISQFLLDSDKAYIATIQLGVKTSTGDAEGEVLSSQDFTSLTSADIESALENFRGEIQQVPSMYSALKHQGTPLYKLARAGKTVERKSRKVFIYEIQLLAYDAGLLELQVDCSKGTYIRTLADDLGDLLGVGAHVCALRRTRAGPFALDQAVTYEKLLQYMGEDRIEELDQLLMPSDAAIQELPAVVLPGSTAEYVMQGQAVITRHLPSSGLVRLYDEDAFIGIGEIMENGRVKPRRLFLPD